MTNPVPGYSVTTAYNKPGSWSGGRHGGAKYLLWRVSSDNGVWHTENVQLAGVGVGPYLPESRDYGNGVKYPLATADVITTVVAGVFVAEMDVTR